jgi:hypothetical protein
MARVKVGDNAASEVLATDKPAGAPPPWPRVLQCPHCNARSMSSQLENIDAGTKRCMKCKSGLSRLNEARQLPVGENAELTTAPPAEKVDLAALGGGFFGKGDDVKIEPKPIVQDLAAAQAAALEKERAERKASLAEAIAEKRNLDDLPRHASTRFGADDEGDEIEVTHPEEMYGLKGTFSSYRVGPFTAKTRIRPGETRPQAIRRVLDELEKVAAEERPRARDAFLKHFEVAFTNA